MNVVSIRHSLIWFGGDYCDFQRQTANFSFTNSDRFTRFFNIHTMRKDNQPSTLSKNLKRKKLIASLKHSFPHFWIVLLIIVTNLLEVFNPDEPNLIILTEQSIKFKTKFSPAQTTTYVCIWYNENDFELILSL